MRGGANEANDAAFHIGQEHILLRFVKAMDLVDEKQGGAAGVFEPVRRAAEYAAHLGHVAFHAAEAFKFAFRAVGNDLSQRGFAGSGGAIKNQGLDSVRLNGAAQKHAGLKDVLLTGVFVKRARAHAGGERCLARRGLSIGPGLILPGLRFIAEKIALGHGESLHAHKGERQKKTQTKPRFDKAQGTMIPRWGRINTLRLPVKA